MEFDRSKQRPKCKTCRFFEKESDSFLGSCESYATRHSLAVCCDLYEPLEEDGEIKVKSTKPAKEVSAESLLLEVLNNISFIDNGRFDMFAELEARIPYSLYHKIKEFADKSLSKEKGA